MRDELAAAPLRATVSSLDRAAPAAHGGLERAGSLRGPLDPPPGSPVPEPGTLLLVGTGLVGVALTVRPRRRRS